MNCTEPYGAVNNSKAASITEFTGANFTKKHKVHSHTLRNNPFLSCLVGTLIYHYIEFHFFSFFTQKYLSIDTTSLTWFLFTTTQLLHDRPRRRYIYVRRVGLKRGGSRFHIMRGYIVALSYGCAQRSCLSIDTHNACAAQNNSRKKIHFMQF